MRMSGTWGESECPRSPLHAPETPAALPCLSPPPGSPSVQSSSSSELPLTNRGTPPSLLALPCDRTGAGRKGGREEGREGMGRPREL